MSIATAEELHIVHALPGRIRLNIPWWNGGNCFALEERIRQLPGIQKVQANELTHNVLIGYDSQKTDQQAILSTLETLDPSSLETKQGQKTTHTSSPIHQEKNANLVRASIPVRGLERDPAVAQRVVAALEKRQNVHAHIRWSTGHVLVEFAEHEQELDDLVSMVAGVDLPDLPGEDQPTHPLDPRPLVQSSIRTLGATLGLGFLSIRRLLGMTDPLPGATEAIQIASIIAILQGIPPLRHGLRQLVGKAASDLLFNVPGIITLTLGGSVLGLLTIGSESLRLLTEVRARRASWQRYEEQEANEPHLRPGTVLHLESGRKVPMGVRVLEGAGTGITREGVPVAVTPGLELSAGYQLYGGPFTVQLQAQPSFTGFTTTPRPAPVAPTLYDRYIQFLSPLSLLYAAGTALLTRSFTQTLASLVLVNPRPAMIGAESSDLGASMYALKAGAIVVGTRKDRVIRQPQVVLLDGARLLLEGLEMVDALSLSPQIETNELLELATNISTAAGSPWGPIFKTHGPLHISLAHFDGKSIRAITEEGHYILGPLEDAGSSLSPSFLQRHRDCLLLSLRRANSRQASEETLGVLAIRPHLAPDVPRLVQTCKGLGIELHILTSENQEATQALARRAGISLLQSDDASTLIQEKQKLGKRVAYVSDHAGAAAAFAVCDLAIGLLNSEKCLPARADLLAPDLFALTAIIIAGKKRESATRDSILLSLLSNIAGLVWGWRGTPGIALAARVVYLATLGALADSWLHLRGQRRPASSLSQLADPHPERWGQMSSERVLQNLHSRITGLSSQESRQRLHHALPHAQRNRMLLALLEQLRSPLNTILAGGAVLSLLFGASADVGIIATTILINMAVSAWQEQKANKIARTLQRLGSTTAHVLRDNHITCVSANDVVPGDILFLSPGERVAADARLIEAQGLEVDEASLTGESLPVAKDPSEGSDNTHIVLAGSDVTTGRGKAVVVAVGNQTRIGATTAALETAETEQSPLGSRLARMLRVLLPVSLLGGGVVIVTGLLQGRALDTLLATGASIALASVPEGLPLLTKVGEAGVARRLATHNALVRRLSAVEALGRVDVACTDKTGTLTRGHLELSLVADAEREARLPARLTKSLHHVLITAALASPHPNAPEASAHPTDDAIIQGAIHLGLAEEICVPHEDEVAFDPMRAFHATLASHKLNLKGAPEVLLARCNRLYLKGKKRALDEAHGGALLNRAQELARRGLRILMVAEGAATTNIDDPQDLTFLGFIAISDPLRSTVRTAVERCQEAGIRVMMITGDHPETARAIASEAGLLDGQELLMGADITNLDEEELATRLEHTSIIARATPLHKLRIVECLRSRGHTVAMTGDGVNDAPALRFADIGIAMGHTGTEVARQTADVVIMNDEISTLVECLIEGRSFWRNIRRSLGLLLGGNLGELALIVGVSLLGLELPLTPRQILAMNAITDILPALAVTLQKPEHRHLATLKREGTSALDRPLRDDILRRALISALPALGAYLLTLPLGLAQARTIAFASIVATQLAQTLDIGRSEGTLTRPVLAAVASSSAVLIAAMTLPLLRDLLQFVTPTPIGWAILGASALLAFALNRLFELLRNGQAKLPAGIPHIDTQQNVVLA
ncbi:cation-translocating P-type ATPase [Ktedonobacter racemifer]|nr:HAD-IC family P-type ATPase [Ktedonobacter racemifer]